MDIRFGMSDSNKIGACDEKFNDRYVFVVKDAIIGFDTMKKLQCILLVLKRLVKI